MKSCLKRLFTAFICVTVAVTSSVYASASNTDKLQSDLDALRSEAAKIQSEINSLKKQANNQAAVLAAIQKKISNTQAQINRCNSEINSINSKIEANKAEIAANEQKIEQDKLDFKKRIRAIYMSNSDSNVRILLGAEDFSQFLQLSQLTASVSSHDKRLIEDLVEKIEALNQKNKENEELLASQVSIKNSILEQQKALQADEAEAQALYNSINSEKNSAQSEKNQIDANIERLKKQIEDEFSNQMGSGDTFINPNTGLQWPSVSRRVGCKWKCGCSIHRGKHSGIDIIANYGTPIYAIADGKVYQTYNSCPHTGKTPMCSCGNGYGNNVRIDHGIIKGTHYGAIYAHMTSVYVSPGQYVKQGQIIGTVGTTGQSTGYHLHFGLWVGTEKGFVNPQNYF